MFPGPATLKSGPPGNMIKFGIDERRLGDDQSLMGQVPQKLFECFSSGNFGIIPIFPVEEDIL